MRSRGARLPQAEKKKDWPKLLTREQILSKQERLIKAREEVLSGNMTQVLACATYNLPGSTLGDYIRNPNKKFQASRGSVSKVFTLEEEGLIIDFCEDRRKVGHGIDREELQLVLQEMLLRLKTKNPERITGYEKSGQLLPLQWVRRFVKRGGLRMRACMELTAGRAAVTQEKVMTWFSHVAKTVQEMGLEHVWEEPSRVWNLVSWM